MIPPSGDPRQLKKRIPAKWIWFSGCVRQGVQEYGHLTVIAGCVPDITVDVPDNTGNVPDIHDITGHIPSITVHIPEITGYVPDIKGSNLWCQEHAQSNVAKFLTS